MKPAGTILTFMRGLSKWFLFNLGLFIWQIVFLVVGKIYGKVKVRWRDIWRAAQVCHVRLCLKIMLPGSFNYGGILGNIRFMPEGTWQYISFGYPKAKLDYWRMEQCDGKRFAYREPTFDPSDEFIAAMIEYAYDQVGKPYDVPQLASYCLNLAIWIVWPWSWGREVVKWFNQPGGHESCSSGVAATLIWADCARHKVNRFFSNYATAMVPPCLFKIDENWRGNEERKVETS